MSPWTRTTGLGWAAVGLQLQSLAPGGSASIFSPASTAEVRKVYGTGSGLGVSAVAVEPGMTATRSARSASRAARREDRAGMSTPGAVECAAPSTRLSAKGY